MNHEVSILDKPMEDRKSFVVVNVFEENKESYVT